MSKCIISPHLQTFRPSSQRAINVKIGQDTASVAETKTAVHPRQHPCVGNQRKSTHARVKGDDVCLGKSSTIYPGQCSCSKVEAHAYIRTRGGWLKRWNIEASSSCHVLRTSPASNTVGEAPGRRTKRAISTELFYKTSSSLS